GIRTTACSKILDDFKPAYESTVGQNLWDAGAVMLGKLNNDEFAMGSSNETSAFGNVVSPWRRKGADGKVSTDKLVPGGSSGGSSAAVAADLCLAAFASSLDQAGPIAKTVRDAAIMLKTMASYDSKDTTSVNAAVPDYEAVL